MYLLNSRILYLGSYYLFLYPWSCAHPPGLCCLPGNSCDCSVQVSRRFTSQGGLFFPTVLSHCLRNHIGSFQAMKLIFCLKDFCLELKTDCAKIVCSLMFLVETYQFPRSNTMGRILAPRSDDRCSDGMGLCPITQQLAWSMEWS